MITTLELRGVGTLRGWGLCLAQLSLGSLLIIHSILFTLLSLS
jgi:hypothetical protein